MIDLHSILGVAIQGGASDVHIKAGLPPLFRINGGLVPLRNGPRMSATDTRNLLAAMTNQHQLAVFDETRELDFAYNAPNLGRFRVNAFYQRQMVGLVMRVIQNSVLSIAELDLPKVLVEHNIVRNTKAPEED